MSTLLLWKYSSTSVNTPFSEVYFIWFEYSYFRFLMIKCKLDVSFSTYLLFNLCVSLYLKWVSWKYTIVWYFAFIQTGNFSPLTAIINPFIFNVITMFECKSTVSLLVFYFFCVFFFYSFFCLHLQLQVFFSMIFDRFSLITTIPLLFCFLQCLLYGSHCAPLIYHNLYSSSVIPYILQI